ncbi:hypothetical protein GCM10027258_47930 [Amycolatopsis stemonae]
MVAKKSMHGHGAVSLDEIIANFGQEVTRKLRTGQGSNEDHLRGPFERMLREIARQLGLSATLIGETRLPELSIRPDYAVNASGARIGYVELKKPGHGVPTIWRSPSDHDKKQWDKFKLLPNVLYSDGENFARFNFGKLQGRIARLTPNLDRAGKNLHSVDIAFEKVITEFLLWEPETPRTLDELVRLAANLCRLLREDVSAELKREQSGIAKKQIFSGLATDWRQLLFPNLTDQQFADQYSQTVTFALLLASVEGVGFQGQHISEIARALGKKHSLMGKALAVLTDQSEEEHSVVLDTMLKVFGVIEWTEFPEDSYAMLYEKFLAEYDPVLRRKSGVYYTPSALVTFLSRFVDEILRNRLKRPLGFAQDDVIVVDPAMGTGSFLAEVIDIVAETVEEDEGEGVVTPRLHDLSNRLIGFENQAAPFAVAELRIHSLLKKRHRAEVPLKERRFLADTLDDPDVQILPLGSMYDTIKQSREGANLVKRKEPVMVVIGNPPYSDKAKGASKWIETPRSDLVKYPSISAFRKEGSGRLEYVLANKYIYFWRWATWKVFDAHPNSPAGVVALVCSAGFLSGPGFAGMREYLRRTADEGWIVDLSPEGHQPPMKTRFFRANQQPICIAVFICKRRRNEKDPATIWRTNVTGSVEEKTNSLENLRLDDANWTRCSESWSAPFDTESGADWQTFPKLDDLFPWFSPGVMPDRTWVYAPEPETLKARWKRLIGAPPEEKAELLGESPDVNLHRTKAPLPGFKRGSVPLSNDRTEEAQPLRVGYRSFDRQWIIPDSRLIARPRPSLWTVRGDNQVYITEQHAHPITSGPGLTFTAYIPDKHHFMGHHAGRTMPLYRDKNGRTPNILPGLSNYLSETLGLSITAPDLLAYVAAVTSHPGYTKMFSNDLKLPGVRIPLTRTSKLWSRAVAIGEEVLWLHTFGERFFDPKAGRPRSSPRLHHDRPKVRVTIPDTAELMPEYIDYDEETLTLSVGNGRISPVAPEVWEYNVAGMHVVKHWFGYRKKQPTRARKSPLDDMVGSTWTPTMTTELLEVLNVLGRCVALHPSQSDLLEDIILEPLITLEDLTLANIFPAPANSTRAPNPDGVLELWESA